MSGKTTKVEARIAPCNFQFLKAGRGFRGAQSGTVEEEQDEDEDGDTMLDDGYCRPSGRKHRSNDRRHHNGEDEPVNRLSMGCLSQRGAKVIRRACEAGYPPRSFLLAPRWIDGLRDLFDGLDVEVFVVSETLAEQVTGFHVHRGALASMCRQTRWKRR
ncbi:unnamed protein product [Cylicocyclus nassatus]|uniref:Uncharacterized protein n=1 Tax=Cylicocyclus nassatus TaxID=53992 RepID=A0AA36GYI9_CYLNA|nr:unnamed protein product [Cylicocyclus nassatus]